MRKKQLFAMILAGALAFGMLPSAAFAAEVTIETTEAGAAALSEGENITSEIPQEPVTDAPTTTTTTTTTTTEVPTTEVTTTEAVQVPSTEIQQPVTEQFTPAGEGETTTTTETDTTTTTTTTTEAGTTTTTSTTATTEATTELGESATDTGIKVGSKYFTSLQYAVQYVAKYPEIQDGMQKVSVIEVSGNQILTETVSVTNGTKVSIRAMNAVTVTRNVDFDEKMFSVSGTGSELHFEAASDVEGASLTVNGAAGEELTETIVSVSDSGLFGLLSNVTLTGNDATANGAAINNEGGNIILQGGTITGNTGTKGAVYSNTNVNISGTVIVKENGSDNKANIYLDSNAVLNVFDVMTGSEVHVKASSEAAGTVVAMPGTNGSGTPISAENFAAAAGQIVYDNDTYELTVASSGNLVLKAAATASPTPTPSTAPDNPTATPTATPTPTPKSPFISYQPKTAKWIDHNTVEAQYGTTEDCGWYYYFVDANSTTDEILKKHDPSKPLISAAANTVFTVKGQNVPEKASWLVVYAKSDAGAEQIKVLRLSEASRPALPTQAPGRNPYKPSVTESTVTGLSQPLEFYPNTFYNFTVKGAGTDNSAPIAGDEKWVPLYWSTSTNPSSSQQHTTWRIGAASGIYEAATYPLYIWFEKQQYNGSEWVSTGIIKSVTYKFQSAAIDQSADGEGPGLDGSGVGLDGGSDDLSYNGDLSTDSTDATSKDTGDSSKVAVDTADTTPIGTFAVLAAVSMLAAVYVFVTKCRKENI